MAPARRWLQHNLSALIMAPTAAVTLVFVYGFIAWTVYMSFTGSRMMPVYELIGFDAYTRLWQMERWGVSIRNLLIFGGLFMVLNLALGLLLAVLLDQRIRFEGTLRAIFLYPMALSFIVTGTVWKWMLNPGLGLERSVHLLGFTSFKFDWIIDPDYAIYTIVIAGVWQTSGLIMAMFLAALRGVDQDVVKAAYMDGASMPQIYWGIIIPSIRPAFFSAIVVLAHLAVKSFDLVIAMTNGGPGYATDLPSIFMYAMSFQRNNIAVGSATAVMMLCTVMAIVVPYLYSELRPGRRHD
ncbi:sugar ABC transporter permease [Piscinibacter gummiphilus]|uniref:Sugar ABC transporter permease n=1 Tax=Piscinibacter gummiphilus TaxID=946333 RepID=A0ABZ0D1F9_9BURK|nr:sugar ABC transporter permease [Piscinibacter gummiphilus]WOB11079.1 sugar ABC transporter permease [Piscinibacter gummiphilus]